MDLSNLLRRHAWWLLLVALLVTLGTVAARLVADARARADALSAELLAAPEDAPVGTAEEPGPALTDLPAPTSASPADDSTTMARALAALSDSLSGAPPGVAAPVERAPEPPPLDPALFADWTTFDAAVGQSRASGRPVLLAFSAADCELCDALERDVFRAEAPGVTVRSAVIPVAVRDPLLGGPQARDAEALERRFAVSTFPTLVLYDPVSGRQQRLKGYPGSARTLRWITSALPSR